ncbi:hypothetical protein DC31_16050 [Microbacterium sp. CH12i]|uniref:hypothetical protein n=1 Tax=Microbacterium sp. CH12i TaxID=1479651 RepID=UPI000461F5E4|nr:hypothetical protein [Microbacterium sp. CH12i]KDA05463.1 hypothetical protein DC31_16050 [Microbacterium sp. CH12i]
MTHGSDLRAVEMTGESGNGHRSGDGDREVDRAVLDGEGKWPADYLATCATRLQLRGTCFRRAVAWTTTSPDFTIHALLHYAASTWL